MSALARVLLFAILPGAYAETVTVQVRMEATGEVSIRASSRAELQLATALAAVIDCPAGRMSRSDAFGEFHCDRPLRRDGLSFEGAFDLAPIAQKLAPADVIELWLEYPRLGFESSSMPLIDPGSQSRRIRMAKFTAGAVPDPIRIQFGYRPNQLPAIYLPLAAMALALMLITMNLARAGRAEFSRSVFLLGTIFWLGVVAQLQASEPLRILLSGTPFVNLAAVVLAYCPPLLCVAAGVALGSGKRTDRRPGEMFAEVFWSFGMFLFFLASVFGAIPSMTERGWISALPWLAAAPISLLVCRWRVRAAAGASVRQLSTGELKERVAALAAKAGHQVVLFVASSTRSQVSNAFALRRNGIVLTAPLIQSLTTREVDAVAAHELSHFGHVRRNPWAALALAAVLFQTPLTGLLLPSVWGFIVALLVPTAVFFTALRAARKGEFAADAGSATLTGDPRAMISALARIARNNRHSIEFSPVMEWFSTHPSTRRRIAALAAAGKIEAPELEILCNRDDPGPRYSLPPVSSDLIFTPAWQHANGTRYVWAALLTASGAGLLIAGLLERFVEVGLPQLAGGMMLGCIITKVLSATVLSRNYARLRRKLSAKLGANGQLVGLAVDSQPRLYNGNRFSDAGLLSFEGGRLCYRSEHNIIELNPADVVEVDMIPASPSFWRRMQPMVRFRHPESGELKTIILHPVEWGATPRRLLRSIERWKATATSVEGTSITGLNAIPGQLFHPPTLAATARGFRIPGFVTLAGAVLAGWFVGAESWRAWYALIITAGAYTFMYLPAMLYRPPSTPPVLTPSVSDQ